MVTGAKNPTSTNRPHHSALASRKKPTQTHPCRCQPRKRLYRARFYHAELGRFISRDPIGYVDGMSLYRAYFAPNYLDPSGGEVCIRCSCKRRSIHGTNSFTVRTRCNPPYEQCCRRACGETFGGRYFGYGTWYAGKYRVCGARPSTGLDWTIDEKVDTVCSVILAVDVLTGGPNEGVTCVALVKLCVTTKVKRKLVTKEVTKQVLRRVCNSAARNCPRPKSDEEDEWGNVCCVYKHKLDDTMDPIDTICHYSIQTPIEECCDETRPGYDLVDHYAGRCGPDKSN